MNRAKMTVNTKEKADGGKNRDSESEQRQGLEKDVTLSDIKTQWHPAFCAAAELEFLENKAQLDFRREYNLGKKPLQIDLLIVEKREDVIIENEIGRFFRKHNVIEYKSPGDEMTIDDFFKTAGYAFIYKGLGKTVNQIPADQLTITLVREGCPVNLLHSLEKCGYTVEKKYNGIYYIEGFSIPAQIIVTRELDSTQHQSLRILSRNALEEDIRGFIEQAQTFTDQGDRENVDAVLQVSASVNYDLFESMKRGNDKMCEAMRRLMNDEIQKEIDKAMEAAEIRNKEAVEAAELRTKQEMALNMKKDGFSDSKIAKLVGVGIEIVQQWFACGMTPAK